MAANLMPELAEEEQETNFNGPQTRIKHHLEWRDNVHEFAVSLPVSGHASFINGAFALKHVVVFVQPRCHDGPENDVYEEENPGGDGDDVVGCDAFERFDFDHAAHAEEDETEC